MRSMLALQPYSPVTSTQGESTMRSPTTTCAQEERERRGRVGNSERGKEAQACSLASCHLSDPDNSAPSPPCRPGCPSSAGTEAQMRPAGRRREVAAVGRAVERRAAGGLGRTLGSQGKASRHPRVPGADAATAMCRQLASWAGTTAAYLALLRRLLLLLALVQLQALLGAGGQLLAVVLLLCMGCVWRSGCLSSWPVLHSSAE